MPASLTRWWSETVGRLLDAATGPVPSDARRRPPEPPIELPLTAAAARMLVEVETEIEPLSTDRGIAEKMLATLRAESEAERAGVCDPTTRHCSTPIGEHVAAYRQRLILLCPRRLFKP